MGDQFLDQNVFAQAVPLLGVVVPAHRSAVGKDVDGGRDDLGGDGPVDEGTQRDAFLFRAGPSSMQMIDHGVLAPGVPGQVVSLGKVDVISDLEAHARAFEGGVAQSGGKFLQSPFPGRVVPGEGLVRLEDSGILGLGEAPIGMLRRRASRRR